MYTAKEVGQALHEWLKSTAEEDGYEDHFFYEEEVDWNSMWWYDAINWDQLDEKDIGSDPVEVPGLGFISVVDQHGGMDEGSDFYVVWKVTTPTSTQYFKKQASYASYDGVSWEGNFFEVKPQQETITVFKEV